MSENYNKNSEKKMNDELLKEISDLNEHVRSLHVRSKEIEEELFALSSRLNEKVSLWKIGKEVNRAIDSINEATRNSVKPTSKEIIETTTKENSKVFKHSTQNAYDLSSPPVNPGEPHKRWRPY